MDSGEHGESSSFPSAKDNGVSVLTLTKGGTRGELCITLSDGSSFFVLKNMARHLYISCEISLKSMEQLQFRSQKQKANQTALSLLARSAHSVRGLEQKLMRRGIKGDLLALVLLELEEAGYLDDLSFTGEWLQSRLRRHPEGRAALYAGLLRRGVSREIAETVLNSSFTDEVEQACALEWAQKLKNRSNYTREELKRKLYSRHFQTAVITRVLSIIE